MLAHLIGFLCLMAGPAAAGPYLDAFDSHADRLAAAYRATEQAVTRSNQIDETTALLNTQDGALTHLRDALRKLTLESQKTEARIAQNERLLSQALGALGAIEASPIPYLMLNPNGAIGTTDAALLFQGMIPDLVGQTQTDRKTIAGLSNKIDEVRTVYDAMMKNHSATRDTRAAMILSDDPTTTSPQLALSQAQTTLGRFRELGQKLSEFEDLLTQDANLQGKLTWPDAQSVDLVSRGVGRSQMIGAAITTDPLAQIGAPSDGMVLFAGAVKNQGQVIIIEPAKDILILLSGLDHSLVAQGDIVQKGDDIALIGPQFSRDSDLRFNENPAQVAELKNEIYLELRVAGQPIDPFPWFEPIKRDEN